MVKKYNDLLGLSIVELEALITELKEAKFRAKQVAQWLYKNMVTEPELMANLSLSLRSKLREWQGAEAILTLGEEVKTSDGTGKLLLQTRDGEGIEMVTIPADDGRLTFCLSTQIGCPVGCVFCASGRNGLVRNLTTSEILMQFYAGCQACGGRRPDNIVFMGIGEGLLNFDNLARALDILTNEAYLGMSPRRITVSTSGWTPGMKQFADLKEPFNLAISLHATNDELRSKLIPNAMRRPIAEILEAADHYRETVNRMVTFEYILLANCNDSPDDAATLAALAKKHHAKINLIAYNSTGGTYRRPDSARIRAFHEAIEKTGAHVTLRISRGAEENAACGQLRLKRGQKES